MSNHYQDLRKEKSGRASTFGRAEKKNGVWERGEKRGAGGKAKAKMKAGEMK